MEAFDLYIEQEKQRVSLIEFREVLIEPKEEKVAIIFNDEGKHFVQNIVDKETQEELDGKVFINVNRITLFRTREKIQNCEFTEVIVLQPSVGDKVIESMKFRVVLENFIGNMQDISVLFV